MSSESNMDAAEEAAAMLPDPANTQQQLIQTEQAAKQEKMSIPDMSKPFPNLARKQTTSKYKDTEYIPHIDRTDDPEVMMEQGEEQAAGPIKRPLDVTAEIHPLKKERFKKEHMYLDMAQAGETSKQGQDEEIYDFSGQMKRPHSPDDY